LQIGCWHILTKDLLKLATKAKMASHLPVKVAIALTSSEDVEDTALGFVFTRKRGRAYAIILVHSSSRGQETSNVAPLPHPSHVLPTTLCPLEGVQRAKGRKAFGIRTSTSPPTWRTPCYALRTRKRWGFMGVTTCCKRP